MEFINNQNFRYATKIFDANKKVSTENLELIKQAIQLSVSSYGLQPYKVYIITEHNLREKLLPASRNQRQITEASHLFIFCNYTKIEPIEIDKFIDYTVKTRQLQPNEMNGYSKFMKTKIAEKSTDEQFYWTKHQTYIALANLLSVCAELKIDSCPMEGFEPKQYNEILGLTEKGLNASIIATIGYRAIEDDTQNLPKVRKSMDLLFECL